MSEKKNAALQGGVTQSLCPQPIKARSPLQEVTQLWEARRKTFSAVQADPTPVNIAIARAVAKEFKRAFLELPDTE